MRAFTRVNWIPALVALVVALVAAEVAHAQQLAGVYVDSEGVLRKRVFEDPSGQLMQERIRASRAELDADISKPSPMRKVSLNRLEAELAKRLAEGLPPTFEMQYLAGLTRLSYVFLYPETGDVVVAGPAEGWTTDLSGRVRGMDSGRPVLELQDLAVALRLYGPGKQDNPVIGCSIDPTQEGLAEMQTFLADAYRQAQPTQQFADYVVNGLKNSMGLQTVSVLGVPSESHFAHVLVEADYRMKLIGIGVEKPPVRMASYVDKAIPSEVARNALQRWYFTPDYECVQVTNDGLAMHLVGEGVKLIGQDEFVGGDGSRARTDSSDRASQMFVNAFTKKYPELAEKSPVYAQLRNLIDMAIAAAYIQQEDYYGKAGWEMNTLGDESVYSVETYGAPAHVETVVTSVWKRGQLMTPVGGGVNIQAHLALDYDHIQEDPDGEVGKAREATTLDLADGQWWWD